MLKTQIAPVKGSKKRKKYLIDPSDVHRLLLYYEQHPDKAKNLVELKGKTFKAYVNGILRGEKNETNI